MDDEFFLKSSWYLYATYNLSFTNISSRSFQWLFNQSLFSWKLFIIRFVILHDASFTPKTISLNHLLTLFNVLKDVLEQRQMFIHKNVLFILLRHIVNNFFRFNVTMLFPCPSSLPQLPCPNSNYNFT